MYHMVKCASLRFHNKRAPDRRHCAPRPPQCCKGRPGTASEQAEGQHGHEGGRQGGNQQAQRLDGAILELFA